MDGYFPTFLNEETFNFSGSIQFFTLYGGFPLIALVLRMLQYLFFQRLKYNRFLDVSAEFFV